MKKETVNGQVTESLPNLTFRVKIDDGQEIIAYTSGKMRLNKIKVNVGDRVTVELDEYGGKATSRIIRRI